MGEEKAFVYEGGTLKLKYLLFTYIDINIFIYFQHKFEIHIRYPSENLGRKLYL